ncbi:hypothetical protein HAX54_019435 [Datura stramonium]|uniref:Uncharacterized protein n=1 Tax=Datura stramonium TaxID=4076 RepID=A0ABS8URE2_DATST|nr:hypothetical protein [Datura stramonium]
MDTTTNQPHGRYRDTRIGAHDKEWHSQWLYLSTRQYTLSKEHKINSISGTALPPAANKEVGTPPSQDQVGDKRRLESSGCPKECLMHHKSTTMQRLFLICLVTFAVFSFIQTEIIE